MGQAFDKDDAAAKWILFAISFLLAGGILLLQIFHHVDYKYTATHLFGPDTTETGTRTELDPSTDLRVAVGVSVAIFLLWPICGVLTLLFCEALRDWAYKGQRYSLFDRGMRLVLAAFWPLTMMFSAVVYPSIGMIHRLF